MAYDSSRTASRSSSSSRGSRGGGGRPGGSNLTALAIAAVLVVGVIVAVVVMNSGGEPPKPKAQSPATAPVVPTTKPPSTPAAPPYPEIPPAMYDKAKALVATFGERSSKAEALYRESQQAKGSGDEATWQSKLKEARSLLDEINEEWNAFESALPTNAHYDQDQVAAKYFARERGQVQRYVKVLSAMKSDER